MSSTSHSTILPHRPTLQPSSSSNHHSSSTTLLPTQSHPFSSSTSSYSTTTLQSIQASSSSPSQQQHAQSAFGNSATRFPAPQIQPPPSSLRYPSNKKTVYDRNLGRSRTSELSRASFAFLFVEMVGYAQRRSKGVGELEARLNTTGYPLGLKLLDLLLLRSTTSPSTPPTTRPTKIIALLQFITTTLWRHLFNRPADALERSAANPAEYMITDNDPLVNQYISIPREMSQLNCAAFVAGIIEGVCDGAGFTTGGVSAHWAGEEGGAEKEGMLWPGKTVFLIRFKDEVLEREEVLEKIK